MQNVGWGVTLTLVFSFDELYWGARMDQDSFLGRWVQGETYFDQGMAYRPDAQCFRVWPTDYLARLFGAPVAVREILDMGGIRDWSWRGCRRVMCGDAVG